ncbi:GNAT family N-acetyltransferase [Ornithinimicrobium faecis]|uniref:GNAT family N-acetyltransferase n=1 Tax=Ornithinimicrobium faecis TaxID=2934158 RepID=UPI00211738BF|nr:GNAT family N-acetyltransferase [Ornithinimicrobium sp. HY1745]
MTPTEYLTDNDRISPDMITGFFVGWPHPPTPEKLIETMAGSYRRVWAVRDGKVVGYINAISDGVLNAFIPWLEVHPDHQGEGIGTELVQRMVALLDGMYAIDLCCDPELFPYYEKLGFITFGGAGLRFPAAIHS